MKRTVIMGAAALFGLAIGTAAFAQSGQVGPAKTPGGSMPSAPSNSTPQSGSASGSSMSGAGMQNDNGGQAMKRSMAPRKMRTTRKMKRKMRRSM